MIGYQPIVLNPNILTLCYMIDYWSILFQTPKYLALCSIMIGYQPIVLNPNIPDFM